MKRLFPYMLVATLMLSGISVVWAVEKKQKVQPAKPKTEQVKPSQPPKTVKPADRKASQTPPKTEKKYDDFVDRNNNGVDDRKENLKKKD